MGDDGNFGRVFVLGQPDYRDPVKMLRNLADGIERGAYGDVETISVATFGDSGLEVFGGGPNSTPQATAALFQGAVIKTSRIMYGE